MNSEHPVAYQSPGLRSINTMEHTDPQPPRHSVIDSHFDSSGSMIIAMCYGKKFVIQVQAKDLDGTIFLSQYNRLVESLESDEEDVDEYEAMYDWMLRPCFPILEHDAPRPSRDAKLTLQNFYQPPTIQVRLFVANQSLDARRTAGRHRESEATLMIKNKQLPPFHGIPRVRASIVTIVPKEQSDDHWCEIPRRVTVDGKEFYFKPAFDTSQYIREVDTLSQMAHACLLDECKTSRLAGIVTTDDEKITIGLLVEWIPSLGDLQSIELRSKDTYHARWKRQVTATVNELHRHGIIWGDVHPGNIVIDTSMNAWVIDFGGGWVEPFVTKRTYGTVEGDLLGVMRVFEHLRGNDKVRISRRGSKHH